MTTPSLEFPGFFPALDPAGLARLAGPLPTWALSTESPWQQWGLAEGIVRGAPGNQELIAAAAGLLSWSWQERPLSAPTLALLLTLDASAPFLSEENRAYLLSLKKRLKPLPPSPAWEDAKESGDHDLMTDFLGAALAGPQASAWLGEAWEEILSLPDRDHAAALVIRGAGDPVMLSRLLAELDYHHGAPGPALVNSVFAPWSAYMAGHIAAREGDHGTALARFKALLEAWPLASNIILLAHDAAFPPVNDPLPNARTAILTYCWNKADLITQTLGSVFDSHIGNNPVFVLDNGSTDKTPDVLRTAQDRYGPDQLHVVTLPVNVGAPGARNWLLSLPEVRECRYAAFLDDDVLLPRDWLSKLLNAALRHPQAGTIGCSIRDHVHPHKLQSADYHLLHRLPGEAGEEPGERLRVFNNCTGLPHTGQFAYERPCLSVSGCCHLLDVSLLDTVGTFDVRFTPTQFDDLDRDIRSFLAGRPCVYTGHLQIDHVQRSSLKQAASPAQVAHILGNKIKLEAKYDDRQIDEMVKANFEMVWRDLLEKQARLRG